MAEQLPLDFEFRANQTFADFFPGTNQDIVMHLQHCVQGTGEPNIYVWGEAGLGKSHLLQACGHFAQVQQNSSFYFDLHNIHLANPDMLNGLDDCGLVCFDNIEFIAGKPDWEQAFFHFFNRHRDRGHQLIVSATVGPNELAIQLADLKTRLNWGLALKIKPLNDSDSIAALIFKAKQMGLEISPKTGRFLLLHYARDFASLWDLLGKLDRASLAAKRKITIPFLKQFLQNMPPK
jgi:DnaA-homolog protein